MSTTTTTKQPTQKETALSGSKLPQNEQAAQVASRSYAVVRELHSAQGDDALPPWDSVPFEKRASLVAAAGAALRGEPVCNVWSYSCGKDPDQFSETLYKQRPAQLRLLPQIISAVGGAVSELVGAGQDPEVTQPSSEEE